MSDEQTREDAQLRISNGISHFFLGMIGVLSILAAAALVAFNANGNQNLTGSHMPMAANGSGMMAAATAAPPKTVTVAMSDPGCHWFKAGSSYKKTMAVTGPVNLLNTDEAALKVSGPGGAKTDAVGHQVSLAPGTYTITMVGQASDDNTLHLAVS